MGNLLEIGVAVYTDGTYCDTLFSERLQLKVHAAKSILRISRGMFRIPITYMAESVGLGKSL